MSNKLKEMAVKLREMANHLESLTPDEIPTEPAPSTTRTILDVKGLSKMNASFLRNFWAMCERNGWNVDDIATCISRESGFNASIQNPLPGQTASGLIQMIDATAKAMGIPGGAAELRTMSAEAQLPFVERYFRTALAILKGARPRRVDYYLALYGSSHVGKPFDAVLASKGGRLYELNSGLDFDRDGKIVVADLDAAMAETQRRTGGVRVPVP